jgi:heterodisulfide reductase subunit A
MVEPYYATVDDTICGGCGTCVLLCPFRAISMEDKRAKINEALCKGCGACASACPAGAIKPNHFTDEQIMAQVEQAVAK